MPKSKPNPYDTSVKEMLVHNYLALLRWLLPDVVSARVLKLPTELPATARRVDLIIQGKFRARKPGAATTKKIVIFEIQCQRDKKLQRTMLLRSVLAHILYGLRVKTILLPLSPKAVVPSSYIYGEGEDDEELRYSVSVRRVFDESADEALASDLTELLPLVPTMTPRDGDRVALLSRVIERILLRVLDPEQRAMMLEQAQNFATLQLPRKKIDGIVQEALRRHRIMLDPLRDFPYVRDGYRKGKTEGKAEGKAESVLTILEARGIRVTKALREKILSCTDAALLDRWLRSAASAASAAEVLGAY